MERESGGVDGEGPETFDGTQEDWMITSIETALVVDDDVLMREFIVETLRRNNIAVTQAGNGQDAKRLLADDEYDMAFIDLKMPGMDGMQLLRHMEQAGIATLPVIVTAFGTVEQAVEAMKIGACDFLMKPFSPEQVELIVNRAREWVDLQTRNDYLEKELGWSLPRGREMLGQSVRMKTLMQEVERVANSSSTVLITGESGTGKELVALAIHSLSGRHDKRFVRMNCAAVPTALMDSELFGHERGAFTGAISRRLGRFEMANGGSLLMDEISEMELGVQAKLLRVLQEREFERVGGSRTLRTDCRVIVTTNRDLSLWVQEGKFRQDLFYRLNVLPIHVPPLRERVDDIPLLAKSFLKKYRQGRDGHGEESYFTKEALDALCAYSWPGNVRELENVVERLSVMEIRSKLDVDALRLNTSAEEAIGGETAGGVAVRVEVRNSDSSSLNLASIERDTILQALELSDGNRQRTADAVGISVRTLRNKIKQYREEGALV